MRLMACLRTERAQLRDEGALLGLIDPYMFDKGPNIPWGHTKGMRESILGKGTFPGLRAHLKSKDPFQTCDGLSQNQEDSLQA